MSCHAKIVALHGVFFRSVTSTTAPLIPTRYWKTSCVRIGQEAKPDPYDAFDTFPAIYHFWVMRKI